MSCPNLIQVQEFGASLEGLHVIVFSNTPNTDFFQQQASVKFSCGYVGGWIQSHISQESVLKPRGLHRCAEVILRCFCLKLCYCGEMKRSKKSVPLPGCLLWRREESRNFVPRMVSLFLSVGCLISNVRKCLFFFFPLTLYTV